MTGRTVPEWRGSTPDAKIPTAVRLRVFARHEGRCHLTGLKINTGDEWHCDHIKPLCLGGEHREANLAPVLAEPHRRKSAAETSAKAKADRIRAKHLGAWPKSKRPLKGRGFAPSRAQAQRIIKDGRGG